MSQNNQENLNTKSERALKEEAVLQFWKENDVFQKTLDKKSLKGDFIFYDGPPTANGMPGLHHVEPQSFKDIIPRYKTMQGFNVPRRAGWDTHGLPVELQVEKELGLKSKKEIEQYGVAEFNQKCKESVWKYKEEWMKMRKRMGYWTDMDNAYITYSNNYIEALWSVVKKASDNGYLYKDFKVLPWCTRCGTGLSSHELSQPGAYKDVKDLSITAKFKIVGVENGYFLAWTTTPWTLPGNVGLAVGADIDYVEAKVGNEILVLAKELLSIISEPYEIVAEHKGSEMVGMEYEPLFPFSSQLAPGSLVNAYKVYSADFVTTTDGTGIVHTAVMYGADDFDLGTKHDLPKFHLVNEEGKFIDGCDSDTLKLSGRYVKETNEDGKPTLAVDIIEDLKKRNLFFKQENVKHSYPHCWRCDTPLIYYARTSWYFRMSALREQLLSANEQINWEPDHIKKGRFGEWLDGIKDWAISRDRYWGTPLPIWTKADGTPVVIGSLSELKKYTKKSGNKYFVMRHGETYHNTQTVWSVNRNTKDPLTEKGLEQIAHSAKGMVDKKIDMIISSPFERTVQTAKIIAQAIGLDEKHIMVDERIAEWNVGSEFDGKSIESYFAVRNAGTDRYGFKTSDGESYIDVLKRVGDFLYEIEQTYQGKNILFVSHGAPARAFEIITNGFTLDKLFVETRKYINFDNAEIRPLDFVPLPHNTKYELDFHKPFIDQVTIEIDGEEILRTPEVMDVWFDSGAMPYAQAHVLGEEMNFLPQSADYISEAIDQTRGWFYTLHAISNLVSDTPRSAYKNVVCLGHVLDVNGIKMSKSKGNVVDPWEMFVKYGADSIRLWMYSVNQPGDSKNFDEKTVKELEGKVFTLYYNVLSFYELYRDRQLENKAFSAPTNVLDQWILARLNQYITNTTNNLDNYKIFEPVRELRDFIGDLSTWYLRRSRDRIKDGDIQAKQTLYFVLKTLAKVMAPFAPFASEDVWQILRTDSDEISVHLTSWPESEVIGDRLQVIEEMQMVRDICTAGNAERKKYTIPVRQPLSRLQVTGDRLQSEYLEIIKEELNIKSVVQGSETSLDIEITPLLKKEGNYRELIRAVQDIRKEMKLEPSDVVSITISPEAENLLTDFLSDFKKTVGASEVTFAENAGQEISIDENTYKIMISKNEK